MRYHVGYCTNVHAGADLQQTRSNLQTHAQAVKQHVSPQNAMGVGLWLSASAADKLLADGKTQDFAGWLREAGLVPYTFNGFPYGDFHKEVVKHDVYLPTWWEPPRLKYTLNLVEILDGVLEPEAPGSISTVPISWGSPRPSEDQLRRAAGQLREVADRLARLKSETGRAIVLAIEPEPGCFIQRSDDLVQFFERYLLAEGNETNVRNHLGVCHDVCHAAVMFESQQEVIDRYRRAGIRIGKVQISSAVCVDWEAIEPAEREQALDQLRGFAEDRYLHQTCIRVKTSAPAVFYEDLPAAIQQAGHELTGQWRVHFHVPVYLESFGRLRTSQPQILECLTALGEELATVDYEVETYAWGVLPAELQHSRLADGIAQELQWLNQALGQG